MNTRPSFFCILLTTAHFDILYVLFEIKAPSGPPQGISAVALDPRRILISWNQPLSEEQNGIIQSYVVNITNTETGQHIQLTTDSTTITAESLHPYYNYHFSVAAVTTAIGPHTEVHSLQTPQDGKQLTSHSKCK